MKFYREKFKEMVLYICHKSPPNKLGRVKLNKILWFSERFAYDFWGETMTGENYIKKPRGPVAEHLGEVEEELKQEGLLKVSETPEFVNTRYRCKHEPNINLLTEKEIAYIDMVVDSICNNHTSVTISNVTHDDVWKNASMGETLSFASYHKVVVRNPTDKEMAWVEQCQG